MSSSITRSTLTEPPSLRPPRRPPRRYLVLFTRDSSRTLDLQEEGELTIGRAPDIELQLADQAASRRHARLLVDPACVHVVDLESHNGTLVNGARISAPRELLSGDVISIGEAHLVFHRDRAPAQAELLPDQSLLRRRLEQEISRLAEVQHRVVVVLCIQPVGVELNRAAARDLLDGSLRPIDALSWDGTTLLVLLPDLSDVEVVEYAEALMGALRPLGVPLRGGYAACPIDGSDVDSLLAGAREAARQAAAGELRPAAQTATVLSIGPHEVVLVEPVMLQFYELLRRFAQSPLPVLICGETGAGKEIAAAAVHHHSARASRGISSLNCATLIDTLAESTLFGHIKGAFTGATSDRAGLFESAQGGSVFLDEVGELSLLLQAKLLRFLETRRFIRVGDNKERESDVRIIAATNRDLAAEVAAGRFRQDLLFRLQVAAVTVPPLRERPREIPILARHFVDRMCRELGRPSIVISPAAMGCLLEHPWPGNVRELKNLMERTVVAEPATTLEPWHLARHLRQPAGKEEAAAAPERATAASPEFRPLREEIAELERTRIQQAMATAEGVQTRAAELLAIPVRTLYNKLREHGLVPKQKG